MGWGGCGNKDDLAWKMGRVSVYALYWDDLGGNRRWSLFEASYLLGQKVKSSEESIAAEKMSHL